MVTNCLFVILYAFWGELSREKMKTAVPLIKIFGIYKYCKICYNILV